MSWGEERTQSLHICHPRDHNLARGEPLCLDDYRGRELAKLDVSCEGKALIVLWSRLCEGRCHKLSAPEHSDVRLWVIEADQNWWPIPQRQGHKYLNPRLVDCVCPGLEEGEYPTEPGNDEVGCCGCHPGHGVARVDLGLGRVRRKGRVS